MSENERYIEKPIRHLLRNCGNLKPNERLLILCDPTTEPIAEQFLRLAKEISSASELFVIPRGTAHGQEPPAGAAEKMRASDLIMSLCYFSLAHTRARIEAAKAGARFLSMPCYSWDILRERAILVDYQQQKALVQRFAAKLTRAKKIDVTTRLGTKLSLCASDRLANACPGFVEKPGDLGSPPDIEVNVSPEEDRSEGIIVIDGSITCPEIGKVDSPITLKVKDGRVCEFFGKNSQHISLLNEMFGPVGSKRRVLAECGIGLNPLAELTGTMLTDEGAMGCLHFGFGSNSTVGGKNEVDFHLDFVLRNGTLSVDHEVLIQDGIIL